MLTRRDFLKVLGVGAAGAASAAALAACANGNTSTGTSTGTTTGGSSSSTGSSGGQNIATGGQSLAEGETTIEGTKPIIIDPAWYDDPSYGDVTKGPDAEKKTKIYTAAHSKRQPGLGSMGEVISPLRIMRSILRWMLVLGMAESSALV